MGLSLFNVTQLTGGGFYNAITADALTYQKGEEIYTPPQFIGEDSDGDTIPDIVEEYGLKPNGQPIGTNKLLKDTDGDGLDDNVELRFSVDNFKNDMDNDNLYYCRALYLATDPTKYDTDGDGFNDKEDIAPLTYEYVNGLDKLCDIAVEYMPNDFYNSQLLVLQTIRKDYYNGGFWSKTSSAINENFISYLKGNYPKVYNAFIGLGEEKRIYINDTVSNGSVDFAHWAATINAYYYDTEINIDKIPDGYNYILNGMADMYIDNFAGWLGDYLTLLIELDDENIKDKDIVYSSIGQISPFKNNDVLADFDALNIYYQNKYMNSTISDAFNKYYRSLTGTSQRYGNFACNLMCSNGYGLDLMFSTDQNISAYREVFNNMMSTYINQDMYVVFNSLLMFSDDYDTDDIITLFRDKETINSTSSAFTDYVFGRISNFSDISVF